MNCSPKFGTVQCWSPGPSTKRLPRCDGSWAMTASNQSTSSPFTASATCSKMERGNDEQKGTKGTKNGRIKVGFPFHAVVFCKKLLQNLNSPDAIDSSFPSVQYV